MNAVTGLGFTWIWCFAHRIHLCVVFALGDTNVRGVTVAQPDEEILAEEGPAGLELPVDLRRLLARWRDNFRTVKSRSPIVEFIKRKDLEQQGQGMHRIKNGLARSFKSDTPHRWSSTHAAMERTFILKWPLLQAYIDPAHGVHFPPADRLGEGDFNALQALSVLLEPCASAVTLLSSSSQPTWGIGIFFEYKIKAIVEDDLKRHPIAVQLTVLPAITVSDSFSSSNGFKLR
jgi:hypothetical protein